MQRDRGDDAGQRPRQRCLQELGVVQRGASTRLRAEERQRRETAAPVSRAALRRDARARQRQPERLQLGVRAQDPSTQLRQPALQVARLHLFEIEDERCARRTRVILDQQRSTARQRLPRDVARRIAGVIAAKAAKVLIAPAQQAECAPIALHAGRRALCSRKLADRRWPRAAGRSSSRRGTGPAGKPVLTEMRSMRSTPRVSAPPAPASQAQAQPARRRADPATASRHSKRRPQRATALGFSQPTASFSDPPANASPACTFAITSPARLRWQ